MDGLDVNSDDLTPQPSNNDATDHTLRHTPAKDYDSSGITGKHILLVEDHPVNQLLAATTLKSWNVLVTIRENGQQAIDWLAQWPDGPAPVDLVLMDIRMPILDGYQTTALIRQHVNPQIQRLPIIGISAHAFEEERQSALKAGMNDYIPKPLKADVLWEMLIRHLGTPPITLSINSADQFYTPYSLAHYTLVCNGDQDMMQQLLALTLNDLKELPDQYQAALQRHDVKAIVFYAHKLRGVLLYIDSQHPARLLGEVERQLDENPQADISPFIQESSSILAMCRSLQSRIRSEHPQFFSNPE
jgi:two-component system, sensor histidine kinase and response regulator